MDKGVPLATKVTSRQPTRTHLHFHRHKRLRQHIQLAAESLELPRALRGAGPSQGTTLPSDDHCMQQGPSDGGV